LADLDDIMNDPGLRHASEGPALRLPEPAPRAVWCPLISVDDHVLEPPALFETVPAAHKDEAPRMERTPTTTAWTIEGQTVPVIGTNGAAGRPVHQWNRDAMAFDDFRAGVHDVDARVADMDLNGVWASLCFPSMVWGFAGSRFSHMADPLLGLACLRAYNDWMLHRWCGSHPDRFISCQLPWLRDVEVAAAEIRANAERGFKAVSFAENPETLGFPSLHSGRWDPFFRACAETGTVVNLHIGSSGNVVRPSSDTPTPAIAALFPLNGLMTLVDWIFSKIPVRFPDLRIVLSEAGASWVPMARERLERADRQRAAGGNWTDADPHPVDVLQRNFWFTSIEDPSAFRLLDVIGSDRVMVETDYPHNDSSWPDSQALVRGELEHLDVETVARICFANAADLYRHPLPPAAVLEATEVGRALLDRAATEAVR
jgi:predicted TIM-barrel fold metal-dependent hydrolase